MNIAERPTIEALFHHHMPLTRAMGLEVQRCDAGAVILTAPLALNHNHLGTAFGGSLATLATAAGYGLLWTILNDPESHLVIQSSSIAYHHPVHGELRAVALRPDAPRLRTFLKTFAAKGKARITCEVQIEDADRVAATFKGTFVALR